MARKPLGEPPTTKCNAKTRKGLCTEDSGANTAHIGYGRCWKHGGASLVPGTGKQLTLPTIQSLKTTVERNQNDPDVFNLRKEIAVSRGVSDYVQGMIMQESEPDVVNGLLRTLNVFLGTTGKLVGKLHDIENGRRYLISVEDVKKVVEDMISIITEEIHDPELQARVLERVLTQHTNAPTIIAPPDSYRYADEWLEAHDTQGDDSQDKGSDIVHNLANKVREPIDVVVPERISLKDYQRHLQIDEKFPEIDP